MSQPIYIGTTYPIRKADVVDTLVAAPEETGDGRSEWLWFRMANGDLMVGFYPQGAAYEECEVAWSDDWQSAEADGTARMLSAQLEHAILLDLPDAARGQVRDVWIGVARHSPQIGQSAPPDVTADQQIDWLLRAITQPGDRNQRRYDLETLAQLVTENPSAGYGVLPIDHDIHPESCIACRGDESRGRDGHQYVEDWTEVWVVGWVYWNGDEQGGGGFDWWPIDTDEALVRARFKDEGIAWSDATAVVRLHRLRVPAYGTDEAARKAITEWIDADIVKIEGELEPLDAVWIYDNDDGREVILRQALHLKSLGYDCSAPESSEIKAWMRERPRHPLTDELLAAFPMEWDEVGAEAKALYLVRADEERDDYGSPLWWSNEGGWSALAEAIVYTPAERASLKPPLGGSWVRFEMIEED